MKRKFVAQLVVGHHFVQLGIWNTSFASFYTHIYTCALTRGTCKRWDQNLPANCHSYNLLLQSSAPRTKQGGLIAAIPAKDFDQKWFAKESNKGPCEEQDLARKECWKRHPAELLAEIELGALGTATPHPSPGPKSDMLQLVVRQCESSEQEARSQVPTKLRHSDNRAHQPMKMRQNVQTSLTGHLYKVQSSRVLRQYLKSQTEENHVRQRQIKNKPPATQRKKVFTEDKLKEKKVLAK